MRILFLTDTREIGGAERYLVDLGEGMAAAGHEAVLAAPQPELVSYMAREAPGARAMQALDDGYHDAERVSGRARELAGQLRRMVALMRRIRPDVLHINNGGWPGADLLRLAALAGRVAGVPRRIMTVHSNPWARSGPEQALVDHLVWRNVQAVICPSRAVASGLSAHRGMPASGQRLIHYGVREPGGGEEGERIKARLAPAGELLVGMVSARPVPEKGYAVMLEALSASSAKARGVLVGRYPEGFEQEVVASGLDGRLELPGLRRDVGAYYHAFDVLAVPSTAEECMPLVILEAAAAGTPAFGSRLSGIPEAIEEGRTGGVFPPGDAAELARLIDVAVEGRAALAEMGRRARRRWEAEFTLDRMLLEHERLYAGLTATHA